MDQEKALIEGCKKSNSEAQKELYHHFVPKMMVVALRYSKSQQEAEDILQEAFIKVFNHIKGFKGDSSLYYWIKRIVVNTALNHQRSKLYLFPMVDVQTLNEPDESFKLSDHSWEDLLQMIQQLPSGCQIIFNMYAIEGYSHKEIANKLNISEGTSKSQYARAKSLLKEKILREDRKAYERAR
ncbi:RNA polymerase sigma factor [Fulvivirga sp. RKSG066]|uniref:RNA polymerase sigma factor n=1 Tax=Fulvivirga aurantia TaxID=2529383 RepID=UPI0012BBF2CC|nr:RNA polymerase sigma factor [Fulvivirga aurantia]MTI21350.1 RNA polymerase sigma factor [Fulvivirga aurantia]